MGSVYADIRIANGEDEALVRRGLLPASDVRRLELPGVLVDTGALTLCLPRDVIESLGLPLKRRVLALTANGELETTLHELAALTVAGRSGIVECLALPVGSRPLLGVIPLEMLGLEPDLLRQSLRVLPDDTHESYILAY